MKIVIISGSARKGNTLAAINAFIKGASEKNKIEIIEPDKLNIAPVSYTHLGIINNVSTILALHIGEKMLAGEKMRDILETVCRENQCRYSIISRTKREKAIVFASDAGRNIAEKLTRLFKDSLPKPIPLEMIAYDYDALFKNGSKDVIFEKYDVLLLVKTLSLRIPGVKSVTLEEIMNFNNINVCFLYTSLCFYEDFL